MGLLSDRQTLALVEQGSVLAPLDRAVRLLAMLQDITPDAASDWALDARDRALILGRKVMFGSALPFAARCRRCGETMAGALDCDELLALAGSPDAQVRAPTSRDLADAALSGDPSLLAVRCAPGLSIPTEDIEARMDAAFPLLDLRVELECESCGAALSERFDVGSYFWREVETRAGRVLDEVHALASAYGWNEDEVLALGSVRRRAYLDRIVA